MSDDELIAEALKTAGYDPPPYVGEDWIDRGVTWLPEGHLSIVRITRIGPTVNGWQTRVQRRQVDADGNTVESSDDRGITWADGVGLHPHEQPGTELIEARRYARHEAKEI